MNFGLVDTAGFICRRYGKPDLWLVPLPERMPFSEVWGASTSLGSKRAQ